MTNASNDQVSAQANDSSPRPKEFFAEYQAALILWKTCPPFVLLLGGFGNIATICVMRRIKDSNSSLHAIFMALAVSDLSLLYTGLLRMWMIYVFQVDMRVSHNVMCKLHKWAVYCTNALSAWLVTTITLQRTLAVTWPHRMKTMCTLRRTWFVIAAIVVTTCLLYLVVFVGSEMVNSKCVGSAWYVVFYSQVFTSVDMCFSSLIPATCQLVCDAVLSWTLFKASSPPSVTTTTTTTTTTAGAGAVSKDSTDSGTDKKRKKTASRITIMTLTVSAAFLLLTVPASVCIIWYNYAIVQVSQSARLLAVKELLYAVTFMMWYCNSAINFLLYCLTGTRFRSEFLSWIRCSAPQ